MRSKTSLLINEQWPILFVSHFFGGCHDSMVLIGLVPLYFYTTAGWRKCVPAQELACPHKMFLDWFLKLLNVDE
jgi:hypothetical protein